MLGKGLRLYKREKLCSIAAINRLFGSSPSTPNAGDGPYSYPTFSHLCYPLRMVYAETARGGAPVQFLVSVPKKRVRLAVNRSLLRRRVREAYRMCRGAVDNIETDTNIPRLDVAFIYVANDVCDYNRIYKSMQKLMSVLRKHPTQTTVS